MRGTNVSVTDNGIIAAYEELMRSAPEFIYVNANNAVEGVKEEMITDLSVEPPKANASIQWTSDKQRRYVMSKFRKKLPYPRQHYVSQGWRIEVLYTPAEMTSIQVYNASRSYRFVEGLYQQAFLRTIGWLYAPDRLEYWAQILEDRVYTEIVRAFYAVGER